MQLRNACALSDGNLSRHISALEKAGAVKVEKSFVDSKPRTTVSLTAHGRKEFMSYLETLEQVLLKAVEKTKSSKSPFFLKLLNLRGSES